MAPSLSTHVKHTSTLDEVQRRHILEVLERTGWRIRGSGGAAQILGLKPTTLESRMARLHIVKRVNGTSVKDDVDHLVVLVCRLRMVRSKRY